MQSAYQFSWSIFVVHCSSGLDGLQSCLSPSVQYY